jgi:uncharacterized protein (DUF58 family)
MTQARQKLERAKYLDPAILKTIGPLDVVAREVVEGLRIGMHQSPLRGISTEFTAYRPYAQGDEARYVDWKVYARTRRYYVKLFEAETNFEANLLLDASSSMRYGSGPITKLEYAKYLAASLAYLIVDQHDSVGLAVFDGVLRQYLPPKSTLGVIRDISHELERAEPRPRTDIAARLHEFARRIPRRGLVFLLSDLFDDTDGFANGLGHLRFRGHNVVVFQIMDPWELEFPLRGMCRFVGMEGEPEVITRPARVRESYLAQLRAFTGAVRKACFQHRTDHVLVSTATPVEAVLGNYLLRRMSERKVLR